MPEVCLKLHDADHQPNCSQQVAALLMCLCQTGSVMSCCMSACCISNQLSACGCSLHHAAWPALHQDCVNDTAAAHSWLCLKPACRSPAVTRASVCAARTGRWIRSRQTSSTFLCIPAACSTQCWAGQTGHGTTAQEVALADCPQCVEHAKHGQGCPQSVQFTAC